MAKIGRNDPCPCGSGKKYKQCCYGKQTPAFLSEDAWKADPDWEKIRRTESEAVYAILGYGAKQYGEDFLREALEEFGIWGEFPIDELHLDTIFIPWVAFNWIPDPETAEGELPRNAIPDLPLGLECLDKTAARFDDYQQKFILSACSQPFSFFSVAGVVPGKSLALRDIFLDRSFTVKESKASALLSRGDIMFAKVVPLDGQAIVVGMAPVAIPPGEHTHLLDIRDEIKRDMRAEGFALNIESLLDWDLEMRGAYLSAAEFLANPPRPELQNTDGDPISLVKLHFKLACSAQEAFDGLRSLAHSQEGILQDAKRDKQGKLLEATFDWSKKGNKKHKSWDNTILGSLEIKGKMLTVAVNSAKRAKKIQSEIAKRLGKQVNFMRAEQQSVDAMLEEMAAQSGTAEFEAALREQEELESLPEVQEFVKTSIEAQWEAWYNESVPALQGKTPLQAARTKAGRERLEALLVDFERSNEHASQPYLRVDIAAMRKRLGL